MNDTYDPDYSPSHEDMDAVLMQLGFRVGRFRQEPAPKRTDLNRYFRIYRHVAFANTAEEIEASAAKIGALTKRFPRSRFSGFTSHYWSGYLDQAPDPKLLRKMTAWRVDTVLLPARPKFDNYRAWANTQGYRVINY